MISFTMKDGRLQMEETFLMIPEFVAVWEFDKTKSKLHANKLLFYIYLMCDLQDTCPTKNLSKTQKDPQCRFMAFGSKDYHFKEEELPLIQGAIDAYTLFNETAEERVLTVYDEKIDQIRHMLKTTTPAIVTNINPVTMATTYASNVDIINKSLKEISNLVKAKNELKQAILAGLSAGFVRGQLTLSPRDQGPIKIRK